MNLKPGTIVLAGAPAGKEGQLTRKIKQRTQVPYESATEFSHAGIIGKGGPFEEATIIEQTWPIIREVSLAEYYTSAKLKLFEMKKLSETEREIVANRMRSRIGESYGLLKLIAFYIDFWIGYVFSILCRRPIEARLFTRLNITNRWVCSQVVAQVYAGYIDFLPSNSINSFIDRVFRKLFGKKIEDRLSNRFHRKVFLTRIGITPDDIDDYCKAHPALFTVVCEHNPSN